MKRIGVLCTLAMTSLYSLGMDYNPAQMETSPTDPPLQAPWFTGPLLAPSAHVVPAGYINIEPYFFYTTTTGQYDSNWNSFSTPNFTNAIFLVPLWIGITEWADIQFTGQAVWNGTQGVSSLVFGDFAVELDFQLLHDTEKNTLPGIKLYVTELFPTGPFERRDPNKFGTDIGGEGSFQTTFGFVMTRLFHFYDVHYLSLRLNGFYTAPSWVDVKGVNVFGGAPNTDAKVKPGYTLGSIFAFEYSLTRNWALACDFQVLYKNRTKTSGFFGTNPDGTTAILGAPSSIQFSIAPAIEYNVSESFGAIAGGWFTYAGRNSSRFISAVIAINYFGPLPKGRKHAFRYTGGGGGGGR